MLSVLFVLLYILSMKIKVRRAILQLLYSQHNNKNIPIIFFRLLIRDGKKMIRLGAVMLKTGRRKKNT
jgi:hypothetical protein